MADPNAPPIPQVNDGYWFNYSKALVDGALKSRDDVAEKLQAFVGWLWSLYTAGAAVGLGLGKLSLGFAGSVVIGSPVVVLVGVYWLTIWVRTPELMQFDPRIPKDIERVYEHNLLMKQRRLRLTLGAAGFAAVIVAWALFYAATVSSSGSPRVAGTIVTNQATTALYVSGNVGDAQNAVMTVYEYSHKKRATVIATEPLAMEKGAFRASAIALPVPAPDVVLVEVGADLKPNGSKIVVSTEVAVHAAPEKQ